MDMLFERLSSGQIVAVISVVSGCIVGLAMIVAITKYQFQALADDTTLKRDKLQANVAYRQQLLDRGGTPPPSLDELLTPESEDEDDEGDGDEEDDEELNAGLAKRFGMLDLNGEEIEAALAQAMATDPARKAVIIDVLDELYSNDAPHTTILAAVRPLCGATPEESKPTCRG